MIKKFKIITISLVLILTMIFPTSLVAFAETNSNIGEQDIGGVAYHITETVNKDKLRQVRYESDTRIVTATYYDDKAIIESSDGVYTYNFDVGKESILQAVNEGQEIMPLAATPCLISSCIAIGFSGKIFRYSKYQNGAVNLDAGLLHKEGTKSNPYGTKFLNELYAMVRIYNSMNSLQRSAWTAIRVAGIIPSEATPLDVIVAILDVAGIDLGGMLESTVLGLREWYDAEQKAMQYFDNF